MSLVSAFLFTRPRLEKALSALDKTRLKLPIVDLGTLFDDFDRQPVTLTELPTGPWSSPVADVVMLMKIALCLRPRRALEVGSYRGYTTKLLAAHTPVDARIVAVDRDPRHGGAYQSSPLAAKIERRVGDVNEEMFASNSRGHYDLIFLDADHTYEAVRRDSQILLPLLAPEGIFVWHDYANWGRFSRMNGVPEFLHELSESLPLAAVDGSWLAMYAPAWSSGEGAVRFREARQGSLSGQPGEDPWSVRYLRG